MARINGYVTQHNEAYEYYIEWEEFNVNQQDNTSSVRATSYIRCNNHTSYANNKTQKLWIAGREFSNTLNISLSPGTVVQLVSATVDNIGHNWDGSLNIEIAASGDLPSGSGYGPLWGEAKANVWLTQIARQANFLSIDIQNANLEHFDVYYNLDKNVSAMQYSLNGGGWQNISPWWGDWSKEATFAVAGLTPNTNYTIQLKATVNGIDTYSNIFNARTLDIARFTSLSDFFFGDVVNITKTNESNWWNYLTIKVGENVIVERRALESNNLVFTFTQDDLDKLYKALTTFNKTTVEFILITNNENQDWTSSKKVQCTFNGNQMTAHYYIADQTRKRAKVIYYIADATPKKTVFVIKKDGKWRKCI
jgi:hypothetical protein|nr:MAG TPA: protein of unknown function DUF859 [Caudoviricetes sp.]